MPLPALKSLAKKSGTSLDRAEELWDKAKERAAEEGHKEDWPYVMGIVKKMLGLGESYSPEDAMLTTEVVGQGAAEKLLMENMPAGIRQNLYQKYINMELQWRRKLTGRDMNWNFFLRSLREAVMILLNWSSGEETTESFDSGELGGVI